MTYSNGVDDVLGEENPLELNQEKVQELRQVLEHGLVGFLGDGVVTAGTEGAGDALLENDMACNLDGGGHWSIQVSLSLQKSLVTRPTHIPMTCTKT